MSHHVYSVPELVLRELRERNARWEVKPGSIHGKLIVNGVFCGVVSQGRGKDEPRFARNLRAQVRQALAK
jgi:hypothetical protein